MWEEAEIWEGEGNSHNGLGIALKGEGDGGGWEGRDEESLLGRGV